MTDGAPTRPPPPPVGYEDVEVRWWWMHVVAGAVLVVLGLALVANPFAAVWILGVLLGASLVVGGAAELLVAEQEGRSRWARRLLGGILIIGGIVAAAWPEATVWVLAVLGGLLLLPAGVMAVVVALAAPEMPNRGLHILAGVVSAVIGVVLLAWPEATVQVLAILVGLRAVVTGGLAIGVGLTLRRLGKASASAPPRAR